MSLLDARYAEEFLKDYRAPRRTAAELIAAARARRARTRKRMTECLTRLVSLNGNVSRYDLEAEGFSRVEIARHFDAAKRAARLELMVA